MRFFPLFLFFFFLVTVLGVSRPVSGLPRVWATVEPVDLDGAGEEYEILQMADDADYTGANSHITAPLQVTLNELRTEVAPELMMREREFETAGAEDAMGSNMFGMGSALGLQLGGMNQGMGLGLGMSGLRSPLLLGQGANAGVGYGFGAGANAGYGFGSGYGFGAGSSSTKRLPTLHLQAAPVTAPALEASPITNYVLSEQTIKQPRLVVQPIVQQRLVEQPITKTRIVTQPVIRRVITQPILQPRIIRTTQVKNRIIDQPITVPKIQKQDVIKQVNKRTQRLAHSGNSIH